jgi:type II secretory pathway component PulF
MTLARALRELRAGRDKAAYYRMWHVREQAGLPWPAEPSPHQLVPFEVALVALGKESGKLEEILALLAAYFAAEDRHVLRVLKHATYPMFTALFAALIGPLRLMVDGHFAVWLLTTAAALALWFFAAGFLLARPVRRHLDKPRYVLGRLLRALTIAVESGLPLSRAALLAAEATGNAEVIAHVRRVGTRAAASQPLEATFAGCPHVPFTAIAAMKVADASGDYGGTLRKLAELTTG